MASRFHKTIISRRFYKKGNRNGQKEKKLVLMVEYNQMTDEWHRASHSSTEHNCNQLYFIWRYKLSVCFPNSQLWKLNNRTYDMWRHINSNKKFNKLYRSAVSLYITSSVLVNYIVHWVIITHIAANVKQLTTKLELANQIHQSNTYLLE